MSFAALKQDQIGTASPVESAADELPVGTKLLQGQFTIESFLSAGGFGITYVARNSLNRQVVIKECFPSSFCRRTGQRVGVRSQRRQSDLRSMVDLFVQEAVNLSKLDHPNIVRVHQVFEDNDTAYMAMDYVQGPDLLETVEGTAPRLAPDHIIQLLHRMLDALGHVHARGFLHRDISPDNIILDETTGAPVLIDFGAARKDETRKSRALSGLRVVKDGYSPQEFYITGSMQAPCSDLYALASSFSHLITGEAPKTSRERLSAIANREGDPQRPLFGRVAGYPDAFLAAIDKAMSIFPRDRLQSVEDWRAALDEPASPLPIPMAAVVSKNEPTAPVVVAKQVVRRSPEYDPLVRAAAIMVLLASLASLAGQIYDRFWAPQRDASVGAERLEAKLIPSTAAVDPLKVHSLSPTDRIGQELDAGDMQFATATIPALQVGLSHELNGLVPAAMRGGMGSFDSSLKAAFRPTDGLYLIEHSCEASGILDVQECFMFNALEEIAAAWASEAFHSGASSDAQVAADYYTWNSPDSALSQLGNWPDSGIISSLPEDELNNTVATCDFAVQPSLKWRSGACSRPAATELRRLS